MCAFRQPLWTPTICPKRQMSIWLQSPDTFNTVMLHLIIYHIFLDRQSGTNLGAFQAGDWLYGEGAKEKEARTKSGVS